MKKFLFVLCFTYVGYGQQPPSLTQYNVSPSMINPAYATSDFSEKYFGVAGRKQWDKSDGSPTTLTAFMHIPLSDHIETSLNITNDKIGNVLSQTFLGVDLAYVVNLSSKARISLGLQVGFNALNNDYSNLILENGTVIDDKAFSENKNAFKPIVGAGLFFYTKKLYLGLSMPTFLKSDNLYTDTTTTTIIKKSDVYFTGGYVFSVSENFKIKPNVLVKYNEKIFYPNTLLNVLLFKRVELGYMHKINVSHNYLVSLVLSKNFKVNYSYESYTKTIGGLNNANEIALIYTLFSNNQKSISPRFF